MAIIIVLFMFIATGDYIASSQVFTFTPSETRFTAVIDIVNDEILESSESFSVRAELVSTDNNLISVDPDESIVTIEDDDSKLVASCHTNLVFSYSILHVVGRFHIVTGTAQLLLGHTL